MLTVAKGRGVTVELGEIRSMTGAYTGTARVTWDYGHQTSPRVDVPSKASSKAQAFMGVVFAGMGLFVAGQVFADTEATQLRGAEAYTASSGDGRVYFYERPEATATSRRKAYVLTGDVVISFEGKKNDKNGFRPVSYASVNGNGEARITGGWMPVESLIPAPQPPIAQSEGWTGNWETSDGYSNASIIIKSKGQGLDVKGVAFWGTDNPYGPNTGEISAVLPRIPSSGSVAFKESDGDDDIKIGSLELFSKNEDGCYVALRRVGTYLLAVSNSVCGGMNVTFNGVYARKR